jgi:hypothetical protein
LTQQHFIDDDAMAVLLDPHDPGFRPPFGRRGVALSFDVKPAMRARPDAGIFVRAPINQVVPALRARSCMV